jgi:hypothetical protein
VRRFTYFAALFALVASVLTACTPGARPGVSVGTNGAGLGFAVAPTPNVVVYGDSLTWESRRMLPGIAAALGVEATQHSFVGTAICDWTNDMWQRVPHERPTVVVLAFYGNSWTPCMSDGNGDFLQDSAKARKYAHDANAAVAIALATGSKVVFVGAPRSQPQMNDPNWELVRDVYRAQAARHPGQVFFVDAGTTIAPHDTFEETMPCLPRERDLVDTNGTRPCQHGRIIVRAPDGVHFCPHGLDNAAGQPGNCPIYMSGGYRYLQTILIAARDSAAPRVTTLPRPRIF